MANRIPLTQGKSAIVDDADFEELSKFRWHFSHYGYAVRNYTISKNKYGVIYMHRQILNAPHKMEVDHKNLNKLDNRRENIRICTSSQNKMNRPAYTTNKLGIKGVCFHPQTGKFRARIRFNGIIKSLGLYFSAEDAHKAYQMAQKTLHGQFARV